MASISQTIQILTNLDCNLRCKYCYEHLKNKGVNDISTCKKYIDYWLRTYSHTDTVNNIILDLIGGEIFLHIDFLTELCEFTINKAHEYKYEKSPMFSISTNGTLISTNAGIEFLKKYGRYCYFGLSIDGTKEIHDSSRVDINGNGTYDRVIEGYNTLKEYICPNRIDVKATYNHDTYMNYAKGVINLIDLGFTNIGANVVFEEIWDKKDSIILTNQFCKVVDYLVDNNLENTVHIFQINNSELNLDQLVFPRKKEQNHCGTCTYMRCLGYNGDIHGCQRFATMDNPIIIGKLTDDGIVNITNQAFIDEVQKQYTLWPEDCITCGISGLCSSCSAIPYETDRDNPTEFFKRKGQCGFTIARATAMTYMKEKLLNKKKTSDK